MKEKHSHIWVGESTHRLAKSQAAIQGLELKQWIDQLVKEKEDLLKTKRRETKDNDPFKFF